MGGIIVLLEGRVQRKAPSLSIFRSKELAGCLVEWPFWLFNVDQSILLISN